MTRAITSYLADNMTAADSVEGIAQWWLPSQGVEASACEVSRALDELVQRHVVRRTCLPGGRVIYSAVPAREAS